jgi:hypothetical protein
LAAAKELAEAAPTQAGTKSLQWLLLLLLCACGIIFPFSAYGYYQERMYVGMCRISRAHTIQCLIFVVVDASAWLVRVSFQNSCVCGQIQKGL